MRLDSTPEQQPAEFEGRRDGGRTLRQLLRRGPAVLRLARQRRGTARLPGRRPADADGLAPRAARRLADLRARRRLAARRRAGRSTSRRVWTTPSGCWTRCGTTASPAAVRSSSCAGRARCCCATPSTPPGPPAASSSPSTRATTRSWSRSSRSSASCSTRRARAVHPQRPALGARPALRALRRFRRAATASRPTAQLVPAIEDAAGTLVPDRREPGLPRARLGDPAGLPRPAPGRPQRRQHRPTCRTGSSGVMHFSNGGGAVRGPGPARPATAVVLKEARPHAGLDADGARRRRPAGAARRGMLRQLADAAAGASGARLVHPRRAPVPGAGVRRGPTRCNAARRQVPADHADATTATGPRTPAGRCEIYRAGRAGRSTAMHERGVVYGDLHLFNIMVRPDGRVALIDFEVAAPIAEARADPALRNQGFAAPRDRAGLDVDRYALACLRLALFLPLTNCSRLARGQGGPPGRGDRRELPGAEVLPRSGGRRTITGRRARPSPPTRVSGTRRRTAGAPSCGTRLTPGDPGQRHPGARRPALPR